MPNIEYRFVVQGRGAFPADMLRYDRCWPARQEDVVTLTLRADRNGPREVS